MPMPGGLAGNAATCDPQGGEFGFQLGISISLLEMHHEARWRADYARTGNDHTKSLNERHGRWFQHSS